MSTRFEMRQFETHRSIVIADCALAVANAEFDPGLMR